MEFANRPSLTMQGIGRSHGGRYGRIAIDGIGRIYGKVVAEELFAVNGLGTVKGDVSAAVLRCSGRLRIEGRVQGDELKLEGTMNVRGPLQMKRCQLQGALKVEGDCTAEHFTADGYVSVQGLLNADTISLIVQGPASVKEIGGSTISVARGKASDWHNWLKGPLSKWQPSLKSELIEGDRIELAYTYASVVSGDCVVIGPGCRIDRVEYRTSLQVHPSAVTGEEVRSQ